MKCISYKTTSLALSTAACFLQGGPRKFSKSWGYYQLRCQYFLLQKGDIQICHCFRKTKKTKKQQR